MDSSSVGEDSSVVGVVVEEDLGVSLGLRLSLTLEDAMDTSIGVSVGSHVRGGQGSLVDNGSLVGHGRLDVRVGISVMSIGKDSSSVGEDSSVVGVVVEEDLGVSLGLGL